MPVTYTRNTLNQALCDVLKLDRADMTINKAVVAAHHRSRHAHGTAADIVRQAAEDLQERGALQFQPEPEPPRPDRRRSAAAR